jgi:hypothetical protein
MMFREEFWGLIGMIALMSACEWWLYRISSEVVGIYMAH